MFPVTAVAAAGWLLLFILLLIVPPSSGSRRGAGLEGGTAPVPPPGGAEPPAVISLLTGKLDKLGFKATLIDLAARGWFQVNGLAGQAPAGLGGAWGPAGSAMCVVPAETPGEPLASFERRVVAHVALRAGARGEVPAPALSDGFEGGETDFMKAFREEVDADARQHGLTRPRLSGRRIGLLCALLLVPAGALFIAVTAAHRHHALVYVGLSYLAGCWITGGIGISRRRSAAGQEALDRCRSAVAGAPGGTASLAASGGTASLAASGGGANLAASRGGGRLLAYAAALGAAPGAVAVFAQGGTKVAWSSYRGGWQQIEIETNTWPWPRALLVMAAVIVGPVLYFWAAIWLGTHGMVAQAGELVGLTVAAVIAGILACVARRALFPRIAEFDGQVIRQWMVKGDEAPTSTASRSRRNDREGVGPEGRGASLPAADSGHVRARPGEPARPGPGDRAAGRPAVARPLAAVAAGRAGCRSAACEGLSSRSTCDRAAAIVDPVQGSRPASPSRRAMTCYGRRGRRGDRWREAAGRQIIRNDRPGREQPRRPRSTGGDRRIRAAQAAVHERLDTTADACSWRHPGVDFRRAARVALPYLLPVGGGARALNGVRVGGGIDALVGWPAASPVGADHRGPADRSAMRTRSWPGPNASWAASAVRRRSPAPGVARTSRDRRRGAAGGGAGG